MRVVDAQPGARQPGHQGALRPRPEPGRPGDAGNLRRGAETPVRRDGHRPPRERDQAASRSGHPGPVAHVPERGHPSGQQPQMPVAEDLLETHNVGSARLKLGDFTLRAEVHPDYLRIEVADAGGPWPGGPRDDGRPHGLDIVEAIAGPHHWGMDEDPDGRIAWAELDK